MTPACWTWPVPDTLDLSDPRTAIWEWQQMRCAVCGCQFELYRGGPHIGPHEDHDHATGLTRGWLCRSCNSKEGHRERAHCPLFTAYRQRNPATILGVRAHYGRLAKAQREGIRPPGLTFRPPPELRDQTKRFADDHRWSMNVAIEQLVTEALDARDSEAATPC